MPGSERGSTMLGRGPECDRLDHLLRAARTGHSGVLVVRGEAGVGKSVLLEHLVAGARDYRVVRAVGHESEVELAFAGVHQICAPMLDHLDRIPEPQRDALTTAFGVRPGDSPDRFLVGLAVLSLLAEVAEDRPLVCVIDDAQWLDRLSAQVLAFVARRLLAEPVAMVFGVRDTDDRNDDWSALPEMVITGLAATDASTLLGSVAPGLADSQVRDRIVAETRGNPLALLELPRTMTPTEIAFGFAGVDAMPLATRIESGFVMRLQQLSVEAQQVLVVAAVEPIGDVALLWRVVEQLGIDRTAAMAAEESGLVDLGARVRFRHPLARSAVLRTASAETRRRAHHAIAGVTDADVDPDRHAWHRAHAAAGPDEEVARALERCAARAEARAGRAAAAAFLERAARLTPEPARRAERGLAAARSLREAGALDAALGALAMVEAGPSSASRTSQVARLRGQIAFDEHRGVDAARLLLGAARHLEAEAPETARETHLEALGAAMWSRGVDGFDPVAEVAEAVRAAPPAPEPLRPVDVVLGAVVARVTDSYELAAPAMMGALDAVRALLRTDDAGDWVWLAGNRACGMIALDVWDFEARSELAHRQVQLARDGGAIVQLQFALHFLANTHLLAGRLTDAAVLIEEERDIAAATGNPPVGYTALALSALRGEETAGRLISDTLDDATARGQGRRATFAMYASAVLDNGHGRYDSALDCAGRLFDRDLLGYGPLVAPEVAEAAARTGDQRQLDAVLDWLAVRARTTPSDWLLGIEARVRALRAEDDEADALYQGSIGCLERTPMLIELARTHLLYGEWLRRRNRRIDAREHLRTAHDMLTSRGITAFAERAARELLATGETVRKRTVDTRDGLTAQEMQIARLAGDHRTNPEIGAQLFLSARTVEWHLGKVYTKLGIRSRRELSAALADP